MSDEITQAVGAPLERQVGRHWVRNYRCKNPECCDGAWPIQVAHTTDTKEHWCSWCGDKCVYESDAMVCDA
jgi:hypothetical protein